MIKDICKRVGFKKEFEVFFIYSFEELKKNEKALEILKEYAGMMLKNERCDA